MLTMPHFKWCKLVNYVILLKGVTLFGTNFGAGAEAANAKADLITIYADLSSRTAATIVSTLDGLTIYPGVWRSIVYFNLGLGATVIFDAQNISDAVFVLITSGVLSACSRELLRACKACLVSKILIFLLETANIRLLHL